MESSSLKQLFCYFHFDGEIVKDVAGNIYYDGGRSRGELINEGMSLGELKRLISSIVNFDINGAELKYTLWFDSTTILDLVDDRGVQHLIKFTDKCAHIYIVGKGQQSTDISGTICPIETHDIPKLNALTMADCVNHTFLMPPKTSHPLSRPPSNRVES